VPQYLAGRISFLLPPGKRVGHGHATMNMKAGWIKSQAAQTGPGDMIELLRPRPAKSRSKSAAATSGIRNPADAIANMMNPR